MLIYMKNHRQEQILEILKEKGKVNVHNLSEYFSVTPKTIRRDLEFLEENGELVRIHGGAEMTKTDILRDKPFGVRLNIEAEKKEKTPGFPAICENSTGADRTGVSRTGILFFWRLCKKNQ